jgi:Zn-finger nucleic acid-binding protein
MDLTCPKCQGTMRSYERNGVTVDQCTDCRGIFLDRGELDRLVDAEASYHDDGPRQQQPGRGAPAGGAGGLGGLVGEVLQQAKTAKGGGGYGQQQGYGGKRKKSSLIGELFG